MTIERAEPLGDFVGKLERRCSLPSDARAAFNALPHAVVRVAAGDVLEREGGPAHRSLFVSSGFVSRQKKVNGAAQIIGVGIAGDAVDLQSLWFHEQDHTLVAHAPTSLIAVEHDEIAKLCERAPCINRSLWHDTLVDAAIFREWALNIGHRPAKARIAHFLLEMATRMKAHGLIEGETFRLPLTQSEMASALGLSLVHTNKSLKALESAGLIRSEGRKLELRDRAGLVALTGFDPLYLHVDRAPKA